MFKFKYHKPSNLHDCIKIYQDCEEGLLLAGGITLIASMKLRLANPSDLIDISDLDELYGIEVIDNKKVRIGAMSTHSQIYKSAILQEYIPSLSVLAHGIGDQSVRNRGTIGGSICNADPAADFPAALLALNADIVTNKRIIKADEFFLGMFETALEEKEIVTFIEFPFSKNSIYIKFSNPASRYAIVGSFVYKNKKDIRIAITGASSKVFRLKDIEKELKNNFKSEIIDNIRILDEDINADIHASSKYRVSLIKSMTKLAISRLI